MEEHNHKGHPLQMHEEMPSGHESHMHTYEHAIAGQHTHGEHATKEQHPGHAQHQHGGGHMAHMGNLKQKFWISLIIAIPIIMLSPMMDINLPFQFSFPGSHWLRSCFSTGANRFLTEQKQS